MDLRREHKTTNHMQSIVIVTLLLAVFALGALVYLLVQGSEPALPPAGTDGITLDPYAVAGTIAGLENPVNNDNERVFYYKLNSKPYFKNQKAKGDILLENSLGNAYLMSAEYIFDGTGEVILRTGLLEAGQHIPAAPLATELGTGTHNVTVNIMAIHPDTQEIAEVFNEKITVYVGEKPAK